MRSMDSAEAGMEPTSKREKECKHITDSLSVSVLILYRHWANERSKYFGDETRNIEEVFHDESNKCFL